MGGRAEQLWHAMKSSLDVGFRMGTYASTSPGELYPLQAADLFAYELSKEFENSVKRPDDRMRWGLREILTMVRLFLPRIVLIDRMELLRTIKEANFRDQTGVEELGKHDMLSAMKRMVLWMRDRGEYSEPI